MSALASDIEASTGADARHGSDVVRWSDLAAFMQRQDEGWRVAADVTLDALVEAWLAGLAGQLDPGTVGLLRLHWRSRLIPYFGSPQGITKVSIAEYGRARFAVVKRKTLQKERSTLRGFLAWCLEQGHLSAPLELPALPRRAAGTPYALRRRGKATEISAEECAALIAALPVYTRPRGGRAAFPVRSRFIVAYETALRPATLDALSAPEHYHRGADRLVIHDEPGIPWVGRPTTRAITPTASRPADDTLLVTGAAPARSAPCHRVRRSIGVGIRR